MPGRSTSPRAFVHRPVQEYIGRFAALRGMRRWWPMLLLSACAAHAAPVRETLTPAPAPPAPIASIDPPYPPCPTPGWATPAALIGAWNVVRSGGRDRPTSVERHDYYPDGTMRTVELRWHNPTPDELIPITGGPWVGRLTRFETREEGTGTWRIDASGLRELRWTAGGITRVIRERLWVKRESWRGPHASVHRRPIRRDDDGVWRGETFRDQITQGRARGHSSRIELRFDPPLVGPGGERCSVEISRFLRVWGDGKPAEWTDTARHDCSFDRNYIILLRDIEAVRRPGPDERLQAAFAAFNDTHVQWVAPDALLLGGYTRDEPETQARAAEPPISRHDVQGIGFCTPTEPPPDAHPRP